VLNVEIQTSFRHSRITFFKKLWTKKSCQIKIAFISQNPFDIWRLQSKVMDKIQRWVGRDIFFDILKHALWILFITFDWSLQMSNGFLEIKVNLIWQLFLIQSFWKKLFYHVQMASKVCCFHKTNEKQLQKLNISNSTRLIIISYFAWYNGFKKKFSKF